MLFQFNRNFQVFPLVTLWADSVTDSENTQYVLYIKFCVTIIYICIHTSAVLRQKDLSTKSLIGKKRGKRRITLPFYLN